MLHVTFFFTLAKYMCAVVDPVSSLVFCAQKYRKIEILKLEYMEVFFYI